MWQNSNNKPETNLHFIWQFITKLKERQESKNDYVNPLTLIPCYLQLCLELSANWLTILKGLYYVTASILIYIKLVELNVQLAVNHNMSMNKKD